MQEKTKIATAALLLCLSVVLLSLSILSESASGAPASVPTINYFLAQFDYLDRLVLHWAGTDFDPNTSAGAFALSSYEQLVCEFVPYGTSCNCRIDPGDGDDTFWIGCYFETWEIFRNPAQRNECAATLLWQDASGTHALSSDAVLCPVFAYLPAVMKEY